MAKPAGAQCNCRCDYCFYLAKERLYPGSSFRMPDRVMESYIRQTLSIHPDAEVPIAWQGGEPTLMGLDFFRRAVEAGRRHARPGQRAAHSIQTNGVLLDEAWCRFLHEHGFLVGLSLDGPRTLHDAFRRDRGGDPVFAKVVRAARLMQAHEVEFNILCTVNAANAHQALEVYTFFRDEIGARYIQFIPIVEPAAGAAGRKGPGVSGRSVGGPDFGLFLATIFDEWVRRDVGVVFVPFFDAVLASYLYGESTLCALRPACGQALALEHNGDLYACDHFVDPAHLLGNILETPLGELLSSERQRAFGLAKSATLPSDCRECRFLFTCHGECPKNRILETRRGEPGLNWLCEGLKAFFAHTERPMRLMAGLIGRGRPAADIMRVVSGEEGRRSPAPGGERPGRNDPCPCGSGLKFKKCHGRA
ncbi:MAG TPA: anaerobic sulfatase maturase [Candidatus Aminicenantes bacterium]|nr:anaerobic sulfatase maturase [Candidatus Aminicenantes bacterium]HRY64572.1 anaerobic sulfatase maturase [Candidatus Aminicenantes bacterium]HRZ71485.1 anaerobic sulfatase maturase [Candidatus Aminicenantes bacterium]